jgi:hypothetical protein
VEKFNTWSDRVRMHWVEICFKSTDTKIERSVSEIEDRELHGHCHEEWDEKSETDDVIDNFLHA